jgi:hypothetical protein
MPDEQGRPTPEELEAYSATLQQLIDEARALQTAVTDELRRMRQVNRTALTTAVDHRAIDRHAVPRTAIERNKAPLTAGARANRRDRTR